MKRLYVAVILIIVAIFICTFSSKKTETSSQQISNELVEIGDIILSGNIPEAIQRINRAEKIWNETETLFSFIIDADKIEEMNVSFSMISAHLHDDNTEHALERLRECELLLKEIIENEKLNMKNIM